MTPNTRRDLLRASAVVGASAIAGCQGLSPITNRPAIDDSRSLSGWAHQQCLPSRIGHRGDRSATGSFSGTVETTIQSNRRFSATPAAADGVLFVADTAGGVSALDLTGEEITRAWHRSLDGRVSTGLTLGDGSLFVPTDDGTVHALDAYSGDGLWSFTHPLVEARDDARMVPQAPTFGDGKVFIAFRGHGDENLYALSASDGDEQWAASTPGKPATPALGSVLVTGDAAYRLNGERSWTNPLVDERDTPTVTGTAFDGDALFVATYTGGSESSGALQALDLGGGTERWRFSLTEEPLSLLSVADDQIYIGGQAHGVPDGARRWRSFGPSHVCPGVLDDAVVAGDESGTVFALDATEGEKRWSVTVGSEPTAGIVFHRGYVIVGTPRGVHLIS